MESVALSRNLPVQQVPTPKSLDIRPKPLKAWVAALPVTDTARSTRVVFAALVELNRLQLSPKKRFEALELLTEPYRHAVQHLQKSFVGQPFPLRNRKHQSARLLQAMQTELAHAYMTIVADSIRASKGDNIGDQLISRCLLLAMEQLSQNIVWSCQFYLEFPFEAWSDVNEIFFLSRASVNEVVHSAEQTQNHKKIILLYKKISLFWLSSPYALNGGEAAMVVKMLEKWAPLCQVVEPNQAGNRKEGIVIDDNTSEPIWHKVSDSKDLPKSGVVLIITELLKVLANEIRSAESGKSESKDDVPLEFLLRMSKNFCNPRSRYLVRRKRDTRAEFTIGLGFAHHFISGASSKNKVQSTVKPVSPANNFSIDFADKNTSDQKGIWDLKFADSKASAEEADRQTKSGPQNAPEKYQCTLMDESAEGYSLHCDNNRLPSVSMGDLVVITDGKAGSSWSAGIVRWLRSRRKGGMDIGVQLISATVYAISIKNPADTRTKQSRALFMPESIDQKQSDSILLPPGNYTCGYELITRNQRKESRIKLLEKLESGPSFQRFSCSGETH